MPLLTARTSTIFIATGGETRVYRSLDEIPAALKRQLEESTRGANAGTILIADKRGREELFRAALESRPKRIQGRTAAESPQNRTAQEQPQANRRIPFGSLRTWLELLLPVAIGASLWAFIESRF